MALNSSKFKSPRKKLGIAVLVVALFGAFYFLGTSSYKADSTAAASTTTSGCSRGIIQNVKNNMGILTCPAKGAKLTTTVEKSFPGSNLNAYPNGKDCAGVTLEAIKKDGTFLENEPLVIEKPAAVTLVGPENTSSGSVKWCFTSTKPIQARITVKVKSLPRVQRTFQLNFNPKFKVIDQTDRNAFFYNLPVTFTAQIDPGMVSGLKTSQLVYTYNRRVNVWGRWKAERREIAAALHCTQDGRCTATIYPDNTNTKRVNFGRFNYRFNFVDQNGNSFTKSFSGRLSMP